jgi:micrococcal nuclease
MRRVLVLLALPLLAACTGASVRPAPHEGVDGTPANVVSVTDGDTVRVLVDGREEPVRLIGIDTPEKDGPFTEEECFGEEATRFTTDLLDGADVTLEFDVEPRDRYDRLLAYVWLGDELVNETIAREGFAQVLTIPPNVRYADRFVQAVREARAEGRGLWSSCADAT